MSERLPTSERVKFQRSRTQRKFVHFSLSWSATLSFTWSLPLTAQRKKSGREKHQRSCSFPEQNVLDLSNGFVGLNLERQIDRVLMIALNSLSLQIGIVFRLSSLRVSWNAWDRVGKSVRRGEKKESKRWSFHRILVMSVSLLLMFHSAGAGSPVRDIGGWSEIGSNRFHSVEQKAKIEQNWEMNNCGRDLTEKLWNHSLLYNRSFETKNQK